MSTHANDLVLPTANWLVPAAELRWRVAALQARLRAGEIDVALLAQNADLGYFCGSIASGWLVVPATGEPVLHVRRAAVRSEAETCWPVQTTRSNRELVAEVHAMVGGGDRLNVVGLELDVLPAAEYLKLEAGLGADSLVDLTHDIRSVRAVKRPWELQWMHAAAAQVRAAMEAVAEQARPGMREIDVALLAEQVLRERGHQGVMRMRRFNGEMFYGQVAAGPNAALAAALDSPLGGAGRYPPVGKGASERVIEPGELLVVDLMGACNGYLSDCTRVYALGEPDRDLVDAQAWCVGVLEHVAGLARPGVTPASLYAEALRLAQEAGRAAQFMGAAPDQARFVGHGIGMEVDEYPFLATGFDEPLVEGMVFALEPKLVFPGRAAVGIEDSFVVTADGVEPLDAVSRGLLVIDA